MKIANYKTGDESKILELFELSFGTKLPFKYWEWRYLKNPHYDNPLIHLMWDEDKLAGHYALSPVKVVCNNITYLTGLSMTTMTHPNYRGKGIFTTLAESVYKEAFNTHGFAVVWGFPNTNSHYGFVDKLNWNDISYVPMLSLMINKKAAPSKRSIIEIRDFNELPNLPEKKKKINPKYCGILRNKEYLNWRFFQNPLNTYKAFTLSSEKDSYLIYKEYKGSDETLQIDIVDYSWENTKEATQEYINALISLIGENIKLINTWALLNSKQHLSFERLGFQPNSPITYYGNRQNPNLKTDHMRFSEITMCYSDVF